MKKSLFLLTLMASAALCAAETIAWLRFEENFESEMNPAAFQAEPAAAARFENQTPAPRITGDGVARQNGYSLFNTTEESIRYPRSEILGDTIEKGSFTIEAFVKLSPDTPEEEDRFQRIIGDAVNEEPGGWALMIHEGRLRFYGHQSSDGKAVAIVSNRTLETEQWHHVAVIGLRDSAGLSLQLYVDGELNSTTVDLVTGSGVSEVIVPVDLPYLVGGYNRFHGWIDEIRISDEALSPNEFLKAE